MGPPLEARRLPERFPPRAGADLPFKEVRLFWSASLSGDTYEEHVELRQLRTAMKTRPVIAKWG